MTRKLDVGVRESILTLNSLKYSSRQIVEALAARHVSVSKTSVNDVIKKNAEEKLGLPVAAPKPRTSGIPRVRTPALARKVKKAISGRNPDTQTAIARKHGVSQTTVGRIIAQDFAGEVAEKAPCPCPVECPGFSTAAARSPVPALHQRHQMAKCLDHR